MRRSPRHDSSRSSHRTIPESTRAAAAPTPPTACRALSPDVGPRSSRDLQRLASRSRRSEFALDASDLLIIQGVCVTDVTSGQTLRFGKISLLGNLEKLPEAIAHGVTKFKSELAVPRPRRSLGVA